MNFKKIVKYLLLLLPWFISAIIFRSDSVYYNSLSRPFFAPPPFIFGIVWPVLYILIAYSLYNTWDSRDSSYSRNLIVNYVSNQLFSFFFFTIKNPFLAVIDTFIVLVSSILLYKDISGIDKKYSKYLIPYIIWNIFAFILILSIFVMN